MSTPQLHHPPRRPAGLVRLAVLGLAAGAAACSPDPAPGEQEEVARAVEDVPAVVQVTAARIGERVGAEADDWHWDREGDDWEVSLEGLPRAAELDVTPDGGFSELELVFTFEEVEAALPEAAAFIRKTCRGTEGVVIELSLREESLLSPLVGLEAWGQEGVVLEFQCADGGDYEFDARDMVTKQPMDDVGGR